MIDYLDLLRSMFSLQDSLNAHTTRTEKYYTEPSCNFAIAAYVELGEYIDSLAYKWWKSQDIDLDNAKVELVDVWHFLMSFIYVLEMKRYTILYKSDGVKTDSDWSVFNNIAKIKSINDLTLRIYNELINGNSSSFKLDTPKVNRDNLTEWKSSMFSQILDFTSTLIDLEKKRNIAHQLIFDSEILTLVNKFFRILNTLDFSFAEFSMMYYMKNALNRVRRDRGYKEGTYKKLWIYNGKTMEDNEVALKLIRNNKQLRIDIDSYYDELISYYDKEVNNGRSR